MSNRLPAWVACLGGAALALPASGWAAVIVDGQNIPSEFGAGNLLATQRILTQFGDDSSGDQFGNGSELNQLYVTNDANYLYIGLTGNLENNGNCIAVFLDVNPGAFNGANFLLTRDFGMPIGNLPRYLAGDNFDPGLDNILFESAFWPNYVLGWSGGSPVGSQTRSYYAVNWTTLADNNGPDPLAHSNEVAGVMTAGDPTASGPNGTLGAFLQTTSLGILAAADNSNVDGVWGGDCAVNDPNCVGFGIDPGTATKGFEAAIPLNLIGVGEGDSVCLFAIVSSPSGFISNQMLPPPATELTFGNIGFRNGGIDTLDFSTISGNQYACYTLVEAAPDCPEDIDGNGNIGLGDLSLLLASFGLCSGDAGYNGAADLTGDNCVGLADLSVLLAVFGLDCPTQ